MFTFDLISDTHWDFWVNHLSPPKTQAKIFRNLFKKIIPKNPSKHLIIAGDIGHYNSQNKISLEVLRETYDNIIYVHGNHDLYLLTKGIKRKYKFDSFNRTRELKEFADTIPGLHYLDGDIINIDGINIGGCCGWYDDSYAAKEFGYDKGTTNFLWKESLRDCDYISTTKDLLSTTDSKFDWLKYSAIQKQKLLDIYAKCSVIITHIPPHYTINEIDWPRDPVSTFYQFDCSDILGKCENKVWVYGHIHNNTDYVDKECRFVTNSLGYPERGNYNIWELEEFKIKTVDFITK